MTYSPFYHRQTFPAASITATFKKFAFTIITLSILLIHCMYLLALLVHGGPVGLRGRMQNSQTPAYIIYICKILDTVAKETVFGSQLSVQVSTAVLHTYSVSSQGKCQCVGAASLPGCAILLNILCNLYAT